MILLEPHPVRRDVSGVAHRDAQPIRGVTQGIDQLKGCCFLSLQPVGIHRIHQSDRVLVRNFTHDVQCTVEVSANRQHFSAVDQSLRQFALGDIAIWNQHEGPQAGTAGIGSRRCGGVARTGTDHGFAASLLGLADGHRHAPILEGSGGIQAVVFHVDLHAFADPFGDGGDRDQRRSAFAQGHHRRGVTHRQPGSVGLNQPWPVLHDRSRGETAAEAVEQ